MTNADVLSLLSITYDNIEPIENTTCLLTKKDSKEELYGIVDICGLDNIIIFEPEYNVILGSTLYASSILDRKIREAIDNLALIIKISCKPGEDKTILYNLNEHKIVSTFRGYVRIIKRGDKLVFFGDQGKPMVENVVIYDLRKKKYKLYLDAISFLGGQISIKFKEAVFVIKGKMVSVVDVDGKEYNLFDYINTIYDKVVKQKVVCEGQIFDGYAATYKNGKVDYITNRGRMLEEY